MGRERGQVADVFEQTCYRECMNPVLPTRMTVDEFLRWSQRQDSGRHELEDGRVITMPAETFGHVKIKDLVKDALKAAIARSSIPYISLPDGMAVRIDGKTAFEPDVLVVALPEPPLDALEIANPIIVVEVLSPSTTRRDLTTKVVGYARVASIQHYVVVDPVERVVLHYRRRGDALQPPEFPTEGTLQLDPPGLEIALADMLGPEPTAGD